MTEKMKNALANMAEAKTELETLVEKWNKESNKEAPSLKVLNSTKEEIDKTVKAYGVAAKVATFEGILEMDGNIIVNAATVHRFETLRVKDVKDEFGNVSKEVSSTDTQVDPSDLQKYACKSIGEDKDWSYSCERFNFRLTLAVGKNLGLTGKQLEKINDSYSFSKLCEGLRNSGDLAEVNKTADPTSKTQLLKALNELVAQMVGKDYKCSSHDVAYLLATQTKKGKAALSVTAATHKAFRMIIMDVLHNIIKVKAAKAADKDFNGSMYTVEYKAKK